MSSEPKHRVQFTPDFLDRYSIKRVLGEGGSGIVYEAEQKSLGRVVAIKFLSNNLFQEEEAVRRFLDEGKITARLQHGNIVTIYDFGVMGDTPYAVFEFVSGRPLRTRLDQEHKLPVSEGLRIAQETLAGLAHAHKQGVVHRDLKPENLLLEPDGRVKIADFGLAKSREKRDYKTRAGVVMGTPEYISPEQASGQDAVPQSDIYSLGVMLYEMVSGQVPFSGTSDMAILLAHVQKPPRPLPELVPNLPSLVWDLVARALEKQPGSRYKNAEEFYEKIEELSPYLGRSTREMPSGVIKAVRASSSARRAAQPLTPPHTPTEVLQGKRTMAAIGAILAFLVSSAALGAYLFRSGVIGPSYSAESIQVKPGVHTASLDWKSNTAMVGKVELREEAGGTDQDWRQVAASDGAPALEHHLVLSELKPAATYEYRFVYPDGSASIQHSFRTGGTFETESAEATYESPDRVTIALACSQPVKLTVAFPGTEKLESSGELSKTHVLRIGGVDPLRGIPRATLTATYEGGEQVEAPLVRVPPLPEMMAYDIEKLDLPSLIRGLDAALSTAKDSAQRQAIFDERMRRERVTATYRAFREISPAFFQSGQIPMATKLSVYEKLLELENLDGLAGLYLIQSSFDVAASYSGLVARKYADPVADASEYDSVKYETKDAAFFPENFDSKQFPAYRDTLEILQGKGRHREQFTFRFRGPPDQRFVRAAIFCKATNLPTRMYYEAVLNDRLKLTFRNTPQTYSSVGTPPGEIYQIFPTSFLSSPENKVELRLKCLPGLKPVFNSLLYEFGLKAQ
ncbi:MAG: protein kinase [Candidatus Wallbacteria bacterium]|nr:protein kinase [Candidatus Wallbacteria bacterium]